MFDSIPGIVDTLRGGLAKPLLVGSAVEPPKG